MQSPYQTPHPDRGMLVSCTEARGPVTATPPLPPTQSMDAAAQLRQQQFLAGTAQGVQIDGAHIVIGYN